MFARYVALAAIVLWTVQATLIMVVCAMGDAPWTIFTAYITGSLGAAHATHHFTKQS